MPYVTGSSVLAVTFKDGVMLACDTLGETDPPGTLLCSLKALQSE